MSGKNQESYMLADEKYFKPSSKPYCLYEVDKKRQLATITFNRPEKLNAATPGDLMELRDRMIDVEEDQDVKAVIFKGAGDCFSSGMDLDYIRQAYNDKGERRPSQRHKHNRTEKLYGLWGFYQIICFCPKATIAQVHGKCYGPAFQIASVCDVTIASEDAVFTDPTYRFIGASPIDMVYLMHTIGVKKVKELMLTGRAIGAKEAKEFGLVNRVVPRNKLDEEVSKVAAEICRQPYDAIVTGKACFEAALDLCNVGAGITAGMAEQTWQSNIQIQPGDFNVLKTLKTKGVKATIAEEISRYGK